MKLTLQATRDQIDVLKHPARVRVFVAGRRWGKTFTVRNLLLEACARIPKAVTWYVSPTYSLCREQYDAFINNPSTRKLIAKKRQQPYPWILWKWGATTGFRSADRGDNLRGSGLDLIAADESAYLDEAFVNKVLRPTLADKRGKLFLTSTFRGENWFYQLYKKGLEGDGSKIKSWCFPTPTGIRFRGAEGAAFLEEERLSVPAAVWDQEYLCVPNANLNAALKYFSQCAGGKPSPRPLKGPCLLGWDTGKVADPSGLVVLDVGAKQILHVEKLPIGTSYDTQLERVANLAQQYGKALVLIDSTGAGTMDAIVDFARRKIANLHALHFKGRQQEEFIKQLDLDTQQRTLQIPADFVELFHEAQAYEYRYTGSRITYGAAPGEKDDLIAALAMCCFARAHGMAPDPRALPLATVLH